MKLTTTLLTLILTTAPAFAQGIDPTPKGLAKELSEQAKVDLGRRKGNEGRSGISLSKGPRA